MNLKQLLKPFVFFGNILGGVAPQERQDPHWFEDAQHFIVRAQGSSVGKDTIVPGLQLVRYKPGERVEHGRLSRLDNFEVGWNVSRTHGKNTCLARSNSEKS